MILTGSDITHECESSDLFPIQSPKHAAVVFLDNCPTIFNDLGCRGGVGREGVNSVLSFPSLDDVSRMHRCPIILKYFATRRKMSRNNWPQILLECIQVFLCIDIAVHKRKRSDTVLGNAPPYHNFET